MKKFLLFVLFTFIPAQAFALMVTPTAIPSTKPNAQITAEDKFSATITLETEKPMTYENTMPAMKYSSGTDTFGCFSSKGYSWNETQQLCVRTLNSDDIHDWAKQKNVTVMQNRSDFRANDTITRDEVALVTDRAFTNHLYPTLPVSSVKELEADAFSDLVHSSTEVRNAAKFVAQNDIMHNSDSNTFLPKQTVSLLDASRILARSIRSKNEVNSGVDAVSFLKETLRTESSIVKIHDAITRAKFFFLVRSASESVMQ